ncbi:MAG: hypothetical protein AAGD43_06670 [Pseudomonadota bacterium]
MGGKHSEQIPRISLEENQTLGNFESEAVEDIDQVFREITDTSRHYLYGSFGAMRSEFIETHGAIVDYINRLGDDIPDWSSIAFEGSYHPSFIEHAGKFWHSLSKRHRETLSDQLTSNPEQFPLILDEIIRVHRPGVLLD